MTTTTPAAPSPAAATTRRPNAVTTTLRHWTPPAIRGTEQADQAAGTVLSIERALTALAASNPSALLLVQDMVEGAVKRATYPELERIPDPDPIFAEDDEPPMTWQCPWCGGDGPDLLVAVNTSVRWTEIGDDGADDSDKAVTFNYDGYGDYETSHYQSSCCTKPVDLPEGWEED